MSDKQQKAAPGEARCHGKRYAELLQDEKNTVPDVIASDRYRYLGSDNLHTDRYTSQAFFDAEVKNMWSRVWQMACREEDIPSVGDYFVYDILDWSILIVRSEENRIQAFYNVCQHRGRRLKTTAGSGRQFLCPYHGFSWNLDGSLKNLPCKWDFPHADDEDLSLPSVKVDSWAGFVFINLDEQCESLASYLEPLPEMFSRWKLEDCSKIVHVKKRVAANWKATAEAFMESYHAKQTHPQIMPFTADTNARYDILGEHCNLSITPMAEPSPDLYKDGEPPSQQEILDELLGGSGRVSAEDRLLLPEGQNARQFMAQMSREAFAAEDGHDYSHASDAEMLDAMTFNVFPNFSPWGGYPPNVIYRWLPDGHDVDACTMEVMLLKRVPKGEERPRPCSVHHLSDDQDWADAEELGALGPIFDQDMANLPEVQKGMKSSPNGRLLLADYQEVRIRHFHQLMDKYLP
jgi:phenylpropionate dioxygenase-like ring-hydroxylating dioxygenase large terminal subunit